MHKAPNPHPRGFISPTDLTDGKSRKGDKPVELDFAESAGSGPNSLAAGGDEP